MRTFEKLQQKLVSLGYESGTTSHIAEFLCAEIDNLQAPAQIQCKLLSEGAKIPAYQTEGASGLDLHAQAIQGQNSRHSTFPFRLRPGGSVQIWAGISFSIPPGWEIQIRPRSGLSRRQIHVCLGTIDSDYRGEVGALLVNLGSEAFTINLHDRIAQAVFCRVGQFELLPVAELDETVRGSKGFGSSGLEATPKPRALPLPDPDC